MTATREKSLSEAPRHLTGVELGRQGEQVALGYLCKKSFEIIERNWRCPFGEVDLIVRDPNTHVVALVEVKTRYTSWQAADAVVPEESIDDKKLKRYKMLALVYLSEHPSMTSIRFDAMGINILPNMRARVHHVMGAYAWDD